MTASPTTERPTTATRVLRRLRSDRDRTNTRATHRHDALALRAQAPRWW